MIIIDSMDLGVDVHIIIAHRHIIERRDGVLYVNGEAIPDNWKDVRIVIFSDGRILVRGRLIKRK